MTDTTMNISGGKGMNIALWAVQILLALAFGMFGLMKIGQSIEELSVMMQWVSSVQPWFVRALGTAEFLGAVGLILPSLTRIQPRLTVAAALCFLVLQVVAVGLHIARGEFNVLAFNAVLIALILFVFWGRSKKSVIAPK